MYSVPRANPVPKKSGQSRFAAIGAPLIAICCLGAAAFIIATTIVLSLIPLYIPAKTATAAGTRDYLLAMDLAAPIGADGTLDTSARQSLGPQVDTALGLPTGSTNVVSGTVATTSRRKRSAFPLQRLRRQGGGGGRQRLILVCRFETRACPRCQSPTFIAALPPINVELVFTFNGATIRVVATGGVSVEVSFTVPPTVAATTSTTASTSTATNTPAIG